MFKANSYFFLAGCNDDVFATFTKKDASVIIGFSNKDSKENMQLELIATAKGNGFSVEYDVLEGNRVVFTEKSSNEIAAQDVYGLICAIANDMVSKSTKS